MSAPPPDDFTDLLVAYDEALATGRAAAFRQAVAVEGELAPRLADAQQCLELLAAVWPGPLPAAFGVAGQTVARFIIERELGRGGFGIVYLAHDPLLRRPVALKVPRLEGVGNTEQQRRFLQEARIAAGLTHPHIVPVYEAGEAGAVCYIASAYCPGQNLAEWLAGRAEPVPVRQAAELGATLADALAYCHAQGVLHRDLKPSNVLLDEHFFPRITDFGLSKLLEASLTETRTSVVMGTPLYMAPEQAGGQPDAVGPEADVYALGAILYELLTGRPPFLGASLAEVLDRIRVQAPTPPARLRPDVPRPLETISLKCLEKEPAQRYASAGALADDLRRYLDGAAVQGRRSGLGARFRAWSQRPERIGEAAVLAVLNGVVGVLCTVVPAVGAYRGWLPVPDGAEAAKEMLLILLYYPTMHFTLAAFTFARHGWAIKAGAVLTPLVIIWATGVIFGWVDTGDYYSGRDPAMRLMLELAAGSMLVLQAVLYVFALRAWNASRRRIL